MFDLSKPVQLRDGRPARVVSEKMGGMFPLMAIVTKEDGTEFAARFTIAGSHTGLPGQSPLDLVNVPPPTYRRVGYLNLGHLYDNPEGAKKSTTYDWPVLKVDLELEANTPGGVRQVVSAEEHLFDA